MRGSPAGRAGARAWNGDEEMSGALEGIRILDLSRLLPGPFCGMLLADLGAEVVKIEEPQGGDYMRWIGPYINGKGTQFLSLNRNKKSATLNLKNPRGAEIFLKLVEKYDVVIDSFRPGVLDRLGVGYETANKINPRIIYCAVTGYGQDGPYRDRAGHDLNYAGYAGILSLTGRRGQPPTIPGAQTADISAAMLAATGILAAIIERGRTGLGQFVDVALLDGAFSMLPMAVALLAGGDKNVKGGEATLFGGQPCYNIYETSDGKHLTLGALEPKFFKKFCKLTGRPDLELLHLDTGPGRDKLETELTALFLSNTLAHWMELLEDGDVCVGPALTLEESLNDPQLVARGMSLDVETGAGTVRQTGIPIKLSRTPGEIKTPPPELGEHTAEILAEAGVDKTELDNLKKEGAI